MPWLAEIPIFGALFRDKQFDQVQREVLFFMTPEVVKDIGADVAGAAQTPIMKEWSVKSYKRVLEVPNKRDDWGLHHADGLGFPERRSKKAAATTKKAEAAEHEGHEEHELRPARRRQSLQQRRRDEQRQHAVPDVVVAAHGALEE